MTDVDLVKVDLPPNMGVAYRTELRRAVRSPFNVPKALALNGVLMVTAWLLTPAALTGFLFDIHRTWAFPTTLETWLLSDAVATNVFATDPERMSAALDEPRHLARLVLAKQFALWTFVAPACALLGIVLGATVESDPRIVVGVLITLMMPFASLGVANWLGVFLPYHPVPLKSRLRPFSVRATGRWLVAVVAPYFVIWPVTFCAIFPSLLLWSVTSSHGLWVTPSFWMLAAGALLAIGLTAVLWLAGNAITIRMAHRWRERLTSYLAD